jgi:hypothetical protein
MLLIDRRCQSSDIRCAAEATLAAKATHRPESDLCDSARLNGGRCAASIARARPREVVDCIYYLYCTA